MVEVTYKKRGVIKKSFSLGSFSYSHYLPHASQFTPKQFEIFVQYKTLEFWCFLKDGKRKTLF